MTATNTAGIVYLLKAKGQGIYKIGLTRDWQRRSRELSVGLKTTALVCVHVENPEACEKSLHARFDSQRLPQSEWFWLSEGQLGWTREYLADAEAKNAPPGAAVRRLSHKRYDVVAAFQTEKRLRELSVKKAQPVKVSGHTADDQALPWLLLVMGVWALLVALLVALTPALPVLAVMGLVSAAFWLVYKNFLAAL